MGFFGLTALLVVAGCTGTLPYVHNPSELNRQSKDFARGVADRSEVSVCYNKYGTDPATVTALARAECARFGKTAVFWKQSYQTCPLVAPVAAVYACIGNENLTGYGASGQPGGYDQRRIAQ